MTEQEQIIQDRLNLLPPHTQEAIKTIPWKDSVKGIGESFGLDEEKLKLLETETIIIVLGLESEENFRGNLKAALDLDDQKIDSLVKSITSEVFDPIILMANSLYELHIPKTEIEQPKPELEIALPEKETLIPEHTGEAKPVLTVEPEIQHKNINLLEEKPVEEKPKITEPKPQALVPPIQAKSIVEEHLSQPVTATSKYVGGIDPYREPIN
ncbi:MAG: hypothetical protein WAV25_01250 [Minisyncoccia bacterium]